MSGTPLSPRRRFVASIAFCFWIASAILSTVEIVTSSNEGNGWWALAHAACSVLFVFPAFACARTALSREGVA